MKHENEPEELRGLPVCSFCQQEYDPYDTHTCAGNQVQARRRKPVEDEGVDSAHCPDCFRGNVACEAHRVPLYFGPVTPSFYAEDRPPGKIFWHNGLPGIEDAEPEPSALDSQSGGDHYRKHAIQPVEYIVANGISFLAGNVIKYATRYRDKGGADDVRKIIHYCQLILEFEYKEQSR